jgi:hypothetical protein
MRRIGSLSQTGLITFQQLYEEMKPQKDESIMLMGKMSCV